MHWITECQRLGLFHIRSPNKVSTTRFICKRTRKLKFPLLPKSIQKSIVRLDY